MAGITDAFQMSCVMTAVGVVAIIANSCVISKFGRRRVFLMVGMSICGVSQFIIAAVYRSGPGTANTGKVSIAQQPSVIFETIKLPRSAQRLPFSRIICSD
jgi:MFS transporter, SP family, sugar:H+ symporter